MSLTCEPFEHGDILEALEVVDEHVGDPEVIEELKGDRVPELRLHGVVSPDSDRKLHILSDCGLQLIARKEDVKNRKIDGVEL